VRKDFDAQKYPLAATFALSGAGSDRFPVTNRDPALLATVVMTGVTALVRATAVVMNEKGVEYPGRDIHDWLAGADITHISNEISFAEDCPPPDPNQTRLIFCSDPKFIGLLDYIGADVIELTGNHVEDWGSEALRHTIKMYNEHNMAYYGGGLDLADSKRTAKFTVNGNKIAFVGCNTAGPEMAWAREGYPGATPCEDGQWMTDTVRQLQADGYMVIVTFQHYEYYTPEMRPDQKHDFEAMIDAGATLVSGSQAHFPQVMEFYNGSFIHYGLGNLFFDQMRYEYSNGTSTDGTRREFIDRHVFYNGRHISTELLTAQLEEYARPRPMTPEERTAFLQEYFTASGW
jgi:poly-gamma-glutamate synthesis protein (capsule biosynthesis protein)